MNKYVVTYHPLFPAGPKHGFGHAGSDIVEADYYRIEGGALIFRNNARHANNNGYPQTVHVFAAGIWAEVEDFHD